MIGPANLLQLEDGEKPGALEVGGERFELTDDNSVKLSGQLARVAVSLKGAAVWSTKRIRQLEKPEDCLVVVDPTVPPIAWPTP